MTQPPKCKVTITGACHHRFQHERLLSPGEKHAGLSGLLCILRPISNQPA